MSWLLQEVKMKCIIAAVFFIAAAATNCMAEIYVYEVITKERTFYTASRLQPDAFLFYNGGEDIIYSLKIMGVYHDKDHEKAMRDYNLDEKNVRYLPHVTIDNNIPRRPFYWWR